MTSTGTARQAKQQRHDKQAAQLRARLDRQRRRRRQVLFGAIAGVVAVVVAVVIVGVSSGGSTDSKGSGREALPAGVLSSVVNVPQATLDQIGLGTSTRVPQAVNDVALTSSGKPLVLYIGSEYCPYCAVERWPFVQALSRFGTFKNLSATRSAKNDVHPLTASFTFYGASYSSPYLALDARELYTNEIKGGKYTTLQKLTPAQQQIFNRYGAGTPLIDIGGKFVVSGATYPPELLDGLSWTQIAGPLGDPTNPIAQGVNGAANGVTAALCRVTNGQPTDVCSAPGVKAADKKL
jgi:hypothetical protein